MELPGLSLKETDQHALVLEFQPSGSPPPALDHAQLHGWIADQGYAGLRFDDAALQQAVSRIAQNASFAKAVAVRVDAIYKVEVAPDKLHANLTVTPAMGGQAASYQAALAALARAGIQYGVGDAALREAVGARIGQPVEVAVGQPAVPGVDGWLEPLVTVNQQRHPRIDENGHVDFRDLGAIPTVNAGDALMRRHPPTASQPGRNVLGTELGAPAGKDIKFAVRLQGVVSDSSDPDLLRAEIAGQPVLLRDGINVEPVVKVDKVDISTGNVEFVGSVTVRGDVHSGMRVQAGGDVIVEGTIESAEVIAGGDVIARGGIVGHSTQGQDDAARGHTARISAKGNIKARYVENAVLLAEQSVFVDESIVQSDVTAIDRVEIGQPGKRKGHVIGGWIKATLGVTVEYLGSPGAGQTRVFVGVNPLLQKALDEQKQRLARCLKEHGDLTKVVQILRQRPDRRDMLEKAQATLKKVSEEIAEAMDEERRLNAEVQLADSAEVKVLEAVYAGTTVALGKRSKFVADDGGRGVFRLADDDVVYAALPR